MPTISEMITTGAAQLRAAGVDDERRQAALLLMELLNCSNTYLISHSRDELSPDQLTQYQNWLTRRAAGEPLQYITGHQEFYGRDFLVSPAVLIPRPETELIIEAALPIARKLLPPARLLDVCTGSGCIAITLAAELPEAQLVATDISLAALAIARENADRNRVLAQINFLAGDLCGGLRFDLPPTERFDICCANPPYVDIADRDSLMREVGEHEPALALFAEEGGLAVVRRLLIEAAQIMKSGGLFLCEIGFDQEAAALAMVNKQDWQILDTIKDLQGIPRTLQLMKK